MSESSTKRAGAWTDEHRREALRAVLRVLDGIVATAPLALASPIEITLSHYEGEAELRSTMVSFGFVRARIDREVRRVRALAEGRLVREPTWRWRLRLGGHVVEHADESTARSGAKREGTRTMRVTRIRRAP